MILKSTSKGYIHLHYRFYIQGVAAFQKGIYIQVPSTQLLALTINNEVSQMAMNPYMDSEYDQWQHEYAILCTSIQTSAKFFP